MIKLVRGTVIVRINRSVPNNVVFVDGCAQGGSSLLQIPNGISAIFQRRLVRKRVTINAEAGQNCPGEQFNNFLDVSPATARMFGLVNRRFLYTLEFDPNTNVLTISLRRTQTIAPFGIEQVDVNRDNVFLAAGLTSNALNLPPDNTVITVRRAGKEKKMKVRLFAEGEAGFSDGFETSRRTAAFFGFTSGRRFVLSFNQITRVLEIRSVGGK
ncbi:hypothetical protein JNUCC32_09785 [Paenibacillus sp. JNUCC32]|uniref:hypothetical protein n=1 Tax=Paenibacillus sp. JNUCC32 TaxID=2777984 RepID=UPI001788307E|nr:hypothetical protein [Paenibacillus sp. JNUCC-32]QOT12277.1 hypothetical protein JNUCC32_09785 [Paenibacillus sp. JNUCC-32]